MSAITTLENMPQPALVLLGLLLLTVALGVTAYLVSLVCSALLRSFGGVFEQAMFRRYSLRCGQGDELLEKGDLAGAVRVFAEAFFLKPVRRDSSLLSDIANYHTGLLSRLLTVADEMGKGRARLPSLADTDRLLAERLEIHLDYFRVLKGGETQQLRQIERSLRANEAQVRAAISRLVEEIRASEERVLYH
ncbi:MAG TPA: hypothetical protein VGX03_05920 [Candidatus Binatia bacterium]|jgi:hypothetical protein|nr:hypothetical protein [Candidatus Binatia bacterium]